MSRTAIVISVVASISLLLLFGCSSIERKLLFFPSHNPGAGGLTPWVQNGQVIGYARAVAAPKNIWLMLHGNGGQAADRVYALSSFSSTDAVFVMEYPGYGARAGTPSKESFNLAAQFAYLALRETYPKIPVCVTSESVGSGPACSLAGLANPPDKLVFIVPFERLEAVARDHFPGFLVSLLLRDNWDNIAALSVFKGPVDIFGAAADTIIPVAHARALAASVPAAKLTIIDGGHNEWARPGRVQIRNP